MRPLLRFVRGLQVQFPELRNTLRYWRRIGAVANGEVFLAARGVKQPHIGVVELLSASPQQRPGREYEYLGDPQIWMT